MSEQPSVKIILCGLICGTKNLLKFQTLSDPLQGSRLNYAMDGNKEQSIDGLLELVDKHQTSDSCRAYQCIKTLVTAANKSSNVKEKLLQDAEKWQWAVNWLREKMDQDGGENGGVASSVTSGIGSGSASDNIWSTDASNEDSLTRTFHRTTSAIVTLEEANAILAEFDQPASSGAGDEAEQPKDRSALMETDESKAGGGHCDEDEAMKD